MGGNAGSSQTQNPFGAQNYSVPNLPTMAYARQAGQNNSPTPGLNPALSSAPGMTAGGNYLNQILQMPLVQSNPQLQQQIRDALARIQSGPAPQVQPDFSMLGNRGQ